MQPQTFTIESAQLTKTGPKMACAEASDLFNGQGFPERFTVVRGARSFLFTRRAAFKMGPKNEEELGGYEYRNRETGCTISVFND